ncbi:MAG: beta strand repeat-containing protein, partial [Ilumatobacteraceae bacterium]
APAITVGRAGQTALWNQAINKIIAPTDLLAYFENGLAVTNNNQYQLLINDDKALNATLGATGPVFNVSTANNSNTNDGLVLSGVISGGASGTNAVVFTKSGAGTMALTNAGNTFGGSGAVIDVTGGILSVTGNAFLGDTSNVVRLSANSGTQGLRLAGGTTYTLTGRTINLNAATVGIDVTAGTTATIDTPFTFSAAGNALQKNDLGTLVINANNSGRSGVTNIAGGILLVDDANDVGTGAIQINSASTGIGAALHLDGTTPLTVANAFNLNTATGSGINNTGSFYVTAGTVTINGLITQGTGNAGTYGAANGATLNINGGVTTTNSIVFNAVGNGIINLNSNVGNGVTFTKVGTGTLNITTAQTTNPSTGLVVTQGTLNVSGIGQFATSATTSITVQNNALLDVSDSTAPLNRFVGTRTMNLANGRFTYTANGAADSTQAFGALTSTWGGNTITLSNAGAANATLTFANLASNVVNGGSVLTFASSQTFNNSTNKVTFGTTVPTLTNSIIQRAVVKDASGTNFATFNGVATTGNLQAFSAYTVSDGTGTASDLMFTNVNGGTAYGINASNVAGVFSTAPTYRVTGDTAALSTPGLNFRGINALKIEGAGTDVTFATSGGVQLALGTGNLLSTAANQTIGNATLVGANSAPTIFLGTINPQNSPVAATAPAFTSVEGGLLVDTGASLTINAALYNTHNVTKGLAGNLTFATKQFFNAGANWFTINGGTVTLSGGENTLW